MGVLYYVLHPNQLRSIIQWKLWHDPVHKRDPKSECPTLQSCFTFLNQTSRSFAAVIQELNPELVVPICLFYLVLRGLDTIEDDMTIDIKIKEPLLRDFHENMEKDGWTFSGNHTKERDRELLVHFDEVIPELKKLKKQYYVVIKDICKKMGNGMADYALNGEFNTNGIEDIKGYELYCHYAAGLVGEGLTRLFLESEHVNPKLRDRPELAESMGQFLQQTNVIRDVHEDWLDGRRFWPKEVWSKHVDTWDDLFVRENREKAMHASSELVLNALRNAEHCLFYMAAVREQSVFNFVAIPQSMAIATLELIFRNPDIFEKHVKITKGEACQLMLESTQNLRVVCDVFKRYARRIHKKNDPRDPSYLAISIQCGRIEQFIETLYPSQDPVKLNKGLDLKKQKVPGMEAKEAVILVLMVLFILLVISVMMVGAAIVFGAKFDKLFSEQSVYWPSSPSNPTFNAQPPVHSEL